MHSNRTALASPPKLEVGDLFRDHGHLLGPMPLVLAKVVRNSIECRTSALGGHVRTCMDCQEEEYSYNSCRNRHCPKCQFFARAEWVEARTRELLPVQYFHVVFTIPHILNALTLCNKKIIYSILFDAASETLKEVAERRLKVEIGFTAVLHTWGQNLMDHPHLHMIVPGGGMALNGEKTWVSSKKDFFLPIRILSEVFSTKFVCALEKAKQDRKLVFPEGSSIAELKNITSFKSLLIGAKEKPWVVYTKKPFAGPEQVLKYLGQYTHRIAISNHRLIKIENECVYFRYKDYKSGKKKIMVLHVKEFMRRFLLHVLPPKFVRLRHYGFLGNRFKQENLAKIRNYLVNSVPSFITQNSASSPKSGDQKESWQDRLQRLTGKDVRVCANCGSENITSREIIRRWRDFKNFKLQKRMDSS